MSNNYCLAHLGRGGCTRPGCQLRHDIFLCACERVMPLARRGRHIAGRKHRNAIKSHGDTASNPSRRNATQQSQTHATTAEIQQSTPPPSPEEVQKHCIPCDVDISSRHWAQHLSTSQHQHLANTQAELARAELDKNGIRVSHREGIRFGIVERETASASAKLPSIHITIHKAQECGAISLVEYHLSSTKRTTQTPSFHASLIGKTNFINERGPRSMVITFHPPYEGHFNDTLELIFYDLRQKERFSIIRQISAIVGSPQDHETLKSKGPFARKKWNQLPLPIIIDRRPPTWTKTQWRVRLPLFDVPKDLIDHAFGVKNRRKSVRINHLPAVFSENSHGKWFQVLAYIEEEQRRRDLDRFNLIKVKMVADKHNYILEVPGLAEGRPSVLVGDYIIVAHHGSTDGKVYEARVHKVTGTTLKLRFGDDFSLYSGNTVDVRFVLNRMPFRRMHQALARHFCPARILFPEIEHVKTMPAIQEDIVPFNRCIGENPEQLACVISILQQPPGSPPFVIFGPPGTGKTVTIVEAIEQLLLRNPDAHILACAPSNSAADIIATKLMNLGIMNGLLRLNATSRDYAKLPHALRDFSVINDNKVFAIPVLENLLKYQVIVATCISGGIPYGLGVKPGHFSHIFIDEAGQASEPEVMIPIKTMWSPSTNIVLAGDIKQLGPIIRSQLAADLGLRHSYLARIMAREVYNLEAWRGQTVVKLIKNFRSHPGILSFSNAQFYSGELLTCGDPALTHSLIKSSVLVRENYPVVFHGVAGKDEREESSPSFFNIAEASLVKDYCKKLIDNRSPRVRASDIGVITPYHGQAHKIMELLAPLYPDIQVGSVEEFQGQERRVIIMSTVRSNDKFLRHDIRHSLGFVANPSRLNVALTRAQALLIVIGDPTVLSLDPVWRGFLTEVHSKGGWRGKEMTWNPVVVQEVIGGYEEELRSRDHGVMEETLQRLRSMLLTDMDLNLVGLGGSDDEDSEEGEPGAWGVDE